MKPLKKLHNLLRERHSWYRYWHNFKYATYLHFLIIFVLLFSISVYVISQIQIVATPQKENLIQSVAATDTLTTQAEWQAGTIDSGTDLVSSPGDVKLFDEAEINPNLGTWSTNGSGSISSLYDGDTGTGITLNFGQYILRDFGQTIKNINKYRIYFTKSPDGTVFPGYCGKPKTPLAFSCGDIDGDGIEWLNYATFGNSSMDSGVWNDKSIGPADHSKIRLVADDTYTITEYEFYFQPLIATHTSAPDQIGDTSDPDRYVVEYETFTVSETEPANSDITYRFRLTTSSGSSTGSWTDYVDYTGSAIDLTTYSELAITQIEIDAGQTYLQVETKFERTDLLDSPVVSDYSLNFHTNKRPDAPEAVSIINRAKLFMKNIAIALFAKNFGLS